MKTLKLTTAAAIAMFATGAFAASHSMAIDADGDGMITQEEFDAADAGGGVTGMGFVFAAVDSDGDGMISEPEFTDAARAMADEDDSNSLDAVENERFRELTKMFDGADSEM